MCASIDEDISTGKLSQNEEFGTGNIPIWLKTIQYTMIHVYRKIIRFRWDKISWFW